MTYFTKKELERAIGKTLPEGVSIHFDIPEEREPTAIEKQVAEMAARILIGPPFPYRWRVRARLPERFGQLCRVIVRGSLNSALIEFEDGFRVVTSRNYLRRA